MNSKVIIATIAIVLAVASASIASAAVSQQHVSAVCSADGRCTGAGGSTGSAGTISPCVGGTRTLVASDGRTVTQSC